jgi:hypothetical protein
LNVKEIKKLNETAKVDKRGCSVLYSVLITFNVRPSIVMRIISWTISGLKFPTAVVRVPQTELYGWYDLSPGSLSEKPVSFNGPMRSCIQSTNKIETNNRKAIVLM